MKLYDKSDNFVPPDKTRTIINLLNCVKEGLGCESTKKIGIPKFSKIFATYNPKRLKVNNAESLEFLKRNHEDYLELTVENPQIRFLKINDRLYYTI